jgi:hypothetical protein
VLLVSRFKAIQLPSNTLVQQVLRKLIRQLIGQYWRKKQIAGLGAAFAVMLIFASAPGYSDSLVVRVERWIAVQQLSGNVIYFNGNASRAAQLNDRLQAAGEGVSTGPYSAATLEVDTQIGTIELAESTTLTVQSLETAATNGRITRLRIERGRASLKLRSFNNPDSRLEIETPAGISGVRGTEVGLNVSSSGKTGVATLEGRVMTAAQGKSVGVAAGYQNVTVPGQPPSQPIPFTNEPRLEYQVERVVHRNLRRLLLRGQVDPTSTVLIEGKTQEIDQDGRFTRLLLMPLSPLKLRLAVTVITPLGREQTYDLELS